MRGPVRFLAMALAVGLTGAGAAHAAIQDVPRFTLAPHTKAQAGAGNAVLATMVWLPPTFLGPTAQDKQTITVTDLAGGGPQTFSAGPAASTSPLLLADGHRYEITVAACQTATCVLGSVNTAQSTGTTRIDATPPAGTVQINGGAAATNNPVVSLNLAASDPLIGGAPDTSSGVTQAAIDVDGDGTFPCAFIGGDTSGCAVPFAAALTATVPPGDGVKTVGVQFGDGARAVTAPCPPGIFCVAILGSPILGNASATAADGILLDTLKPLAIATQSRFTVERGGEVSFDSGGSLDNSPVTPSGIDPAATTWDFKDGTPVVTGPAVSHTFARAGTFVGELRVRDRAGNLSDPRPFSVTVTPRPGETPAGGGSIAGISGNAGFAISRLNVTARYVQSRLVGRIAFSGTSSLAGPLRVEIRKTPRGKVLRRVATILPSTAFGRTVSLPPTLLPGAYRLTFAGPGGTLSTRLTLRAPRVGVVSSARVRLTGGAARARFVFAARPVRALRPALVVSWARRGDSGVVDVGSGRVVRAVLPPAATAAPGVLRVVLRAGRTPVATATVRVR